jgi:hypothetical protein
MKKQKIGLLAFIVIATFAACSGSKKSSSTANTTNTNNNATNTNTSNEPLVTVKPATGINAPTETDLTAIKAKYADVTMEKLKEGHLLYTEGACTNCHSAKNIYKRPESEWKHIIDEMAEKARITEAQKDAVYKYVLAMKATQPK